MKCLVLGGGGFLGSHLACALLEQGEKVRVFDRSTQNRHPAQGVEWKEGDFSNSQEVQSALEGCEVVYHLISTTIPKNSNEDPVYDVESNVAGTVRMLGQACKAGVRKVVFVSSGGTVYGVPQTIPIPETHLNQPTCSYGIGKLMIEKYLHLFRELYGLDYCVLRMANPFGPRQNVCGAQGAVTVFLHKAIHDEGIEIWGDGSVVRDFLYVSDGVAALLKAATCKSDVPVFNIGSGEGKSLNQVIKAIENLLDRPIKKRYSAARAFDVPSNVLDISRAATELSWKPQVRFEDGLRMTWEWLSQQARLSSLRTVPAP